MARRFLSGIDLLGQLVTSIGANLSSGRLLGRSSAATGAIEEISIGSGLSLSSGTLSATGFASVGSGPPTSTPANGTMYIDQTNLRLYVRVNNAWTYAQLGPLTWQAGG